MLEVLKEKDFDSVVDYAFGLTQNVKTASYPLFIDGIKAKDDFVRGATFAFRGDDEKILLFKFEGQLRGYIQYIYDRDDNGVSAFACLCDGLYDVMLDEFVRYISDLYPRASIGLGFPAENVDAARALDRLGFVIDEESCNTTLHTADRLLSSVPADTYRIGKAGFDKFRELHDIASEGMYWTSERIAGAMNRWSIFGCDRDGKTVGVLYALDENILSEVFGVDFVGDVFDESAFRSLISAYIADAADTGVRDIVYFCDDEKSVEILKEFGFRFVGIYRYYVLVGNVQSNG